MYCSKCGEADQNANSYCRKCGNFLSSQKIIALVLIMNVMVFALGFITFLILFSIYVTGSEESYRNTIKGTYVTFGSIAFIQFLSSIYLGWLLTKMNGVPSKSDFPSEDIQTELTNSETKDLLPPADLQSVIPSVVEETTTNLEKVSQNNAIKF